MGQQIYFLTGLPVLEVMRFLQGALIICGFIAIAAIIGWLTVTVKGGKNE